MKRLRALAIAEAANPEWASVPLVGWSHVQALAEVADVHLVTQVRNRDAICRAGWIEGRDFTAIDSEAVAAPLYKLAGLLRGGAGRGWTVTTALGSLTYYYFEHLLWQQFGHRIRAGEFDIVHRVTPLSPTAASPIAQKVRRANVPFVLGPLNGGLPWPRQFDSARRAEFEWLSYVRGAYRLLPGYASTRRWASAILVGSKATLEQMPRCWRHKCLYVPENGIDTTRFTAVRSRKASRPLRVIFVGRLVTYKGPDMLLEAAESLLARGELTLEFVGTGPLEESLRQFVDERGLQPAVHFAGWVEHAQVQHRLAEADLLALPSIREFGGGVVLEAMAVGLVPLVVNYGGPAELITPRTGFTIELGTRGQIVERLREQLAELVARPELIDERCGPARRRVAQHFTWSAKARQVLGVYARLLGQDSSTEMPASAGPLLPHSRLAKACRSVNKAMAGKKEEAQWLAC